MKVLLLAIRSLLRFRLYTVINIVGLALSLACVIIISRYVYSEATTDHFNTHHERLYLSVRHWESGEQSPSFFTTENALIKSRYKNPLDIPEIEKKTSFVSLHDVSIKVDERTFSAHVLATDSLFLDILNYPVIECSRNNLLADPKGAVITDQYARKLFGKESPIGKTIVYNGELLSIQGVTGKSGTPSSLQFDVLISKALQWRWPPVNYFSVVVAAPGTDISQINNKIKTEVQKAGTKIFFFQLFPLDKLYMDKTIEKDKNTFRQGHLESQHVLIIVAILILLIGIFNYIHISSVIILKRGREFGMKKVFGARPLQLFIQLYTENLVLTAVALFIGWIFIEVTDNIQTNMLDITTIVNPSFNIRLSVAFLLGLPLIVTLYPFFNYSYRQTVSSLRGVVPGKNRMNTRSIFLVVQYGITCCLIISSLFFMKQLNFMLNADLGYQTKDIIKTWFLRPSSQMAYSQEYIQQAEGTSKYIQEAIQTSPLFQSYCFGCSPYEITDDPFNSLNMRTPQGEWQEVLYITVYKQFFDLHNIPVTSNQFPENENEILLNETARQLFCKDGKDPTEVEMESYGGIQAYRVKGFTSEFQVVHLSQHNRPVIIGIKDTQNEAMRPGKLMASIVPGQRQEAIQFLKKLHEKTVGGEFEYTFVEDEINAMYEKDRLVTRIYSVFAFIAILISSLGLFALSLFDIQQRYKEIAIRKVNGANTWTILKMLLLKYYKLLGISFLIALPLSWLAINRYLEDFANKAPVSWWIFAVALILTAGISLLTLIWQTGKAARTNPAEAIKTE